MITYIIIAVVVYVATSCIAYKAGHHDGYMKAYHAWSPPQWTSAKKNLTHEMLKADGHINCSCIDCIVDRNSK